MLIFSFLQQPDVIAWMFVSYLSNESIEKLTKKTKSHLENLDVCVDWKINERTNHNTELLWEVSTFRFLV